MPKTTRAVPWPFRFWKHVQFSDEGCWEWNGYRSASGYGKFTIGHDPWAPPEKYFALPAHQVTYWYFNGPVPRGLQIDHLCRNRACVHPDHLEAVTAKENARRRRPPAVHPNSRKTHCPKGHQYTEENTYMYKGRRNCRTCIHARNTGRSEAA